MAQDHDRAASAVSTELDQMFASLNELCLRSRDMLTEDKVTLEDARLLSRYVTEVRVLLAELLQLEGRLHMGTRLRAMLGDLQELYWGLESMVKEARNSLDREHRGI